MSAGKAKARSFFQNPWPWALFGLPALTMVAGVVTVVLALRSEDGLVADDYYKQGLAINQALARDDAAKRQGLHASVALREGRIRVQVLGNAGLRLPQTLTMRWMHPTHSGSDQSVVLSLGDGVYTAELPTVAIGRWNVSIEDSAREWRLVGALTLPLSEALDIYP